MRFYLPLTTDLPKTDSTRGRHLLPYSLSRAASASAGLGVSSGSQISDFNVTLAASLLLINLILCGYLHSFAWLWLSPLIAVPFIVFGFCEPGYVEVSPAGLRFYYIHHPIYYTSRLIKWEEISAISYSDSGATDSKAGKCVDITINTGLMRFNEKLIFDLATSVISVPCESNGTRIRLLESAFVHETDQSTLRMALRKYVPEDRMDSNFVAREEYGEIPSYTALWLNSLRDSKTGVVQSLPVGLTLAEGGYEIQEQIGAGGQSVVYAASKIDGDNKEHCVLKQFVLPNRGGIEIRKRTIENVQREGHLLRSLDHPRIVRYRDMFIEGAFAFLVLEKVNGRSLRAAVETSGPMPETRVAAMSDEMCDVLAYLHTLHPPIVHRDFTPENLLLSDDGHITLIDFNVAERLESDATKTVVGKHSYIPPEQFRGKPTPRATFML